MAESTLNIIWSEHIARVSSFLGLSRGPAYGEPPLSAKDQFDVDGIVASGLRRFYYPHVPDNPSGTAHYDWSFLHPVANLDFPLGASIIPLPDDYGGPEGPVTVVSTAITAQPWLIEWRNEAELREKYAVAPTMSGPPMFVAEQVLKGTTATRSNRRQLFLFPIADQDYGLQLGYFINPDYLSGAFPYAYGGAQHAETLLEACLAVAEERLDDSSTVHAQAFADRLLASISMDRRNKSANLGYNGDRSDTKDRYWDRTQEHYWAPAATYGGQPFG